MEKRTVLHALHQARNARIIPFAGWQMPVNYGSQIEEHHAVRRDAGMFDVSHMLAVDLSGDRATDYLRRLLANDVARLSQPGKALYSCMLNPEGGVIDDLIVYYLSPTRFRIVVNAGNAETDLAWMTAQATAFGVTLTPRRDLAMIAVQGPNARAKAAACLPEVLRDSALALKPFFAVVADHPWFVARTGYTGEDGFEIALPEGQAVALWECLEAQGVSPCGLGARDTLRLEAGMNLHGSDMDAAVSPLEAGLDWTIAWEPADRAFIGRTALEAQRAAGGLRRFVGLVLEGQGVLRSHQKVFSDGREVGEITSGGFAPTLNRSIALARVAADCGERCEVDIRGRMQPARVVVPVFARNGQIKVAL